MSEENCPRCCSERSPHFDQDFESKVWKCGTYKEPSGNVYESELCETRQELRIQRELATQFEAGAALLIVRAEKAEAELERLRADFKLNDASAARGIEMFAELHRKAEAELAEADRVLAIHKRDFSAYFETKMELANCRAELAKQDQEFVRVENILATKNKRLHQTQAELAEADRVLAIHRRDYESHFKAHHEELAKREKALEQAVSLLAGNDFELIEGRPSDYPELAEWLRNREK